MGGDYNSCRDAYFTCMDQFCGNANDNYRRCTCSARLDDIQALERQVRQTGQQLQDFHDLNIDVISMSSAEVAAMLKGTAGEYAGASARRTDDSAAAQTLAGISAVLAGTRGAALATAGKLDIGGDINEIWAASALIGGADIQNLTGRKLYDQVHAQCVVMAEPYCGRQATVNMVVAAYGMYIEQDCNVVKAQLEGRRIQAAAAIRATEREMGAARLDNYNVHNSAEINECIAQVRRDITSPDACGPEYVRCMDTTGMYLDFVTGEPLYTPQLFHLENLLSLDGDVLVNPQNRLFVSLLNNKKPFAARGLDTCRDISGHVWDEFLRTAIVEIYQGQQKRVRTAKDDCVNVLNQCFDQSLTQLKDFSHQAAEMLAGYRIELSEELCRSRLDTCANLYGGGEPGLAELRALMHNIGNAMLYDNCPTLMNDFARTICTPLSHDTVNVFPYDCRSFEPGGIVECGSNDKLQDCTDTLFYRFVNYAKDYCVRPGEREEIFKDQKIMGFINSTLDDLKFSMRKMLRERCESFDGLWKDSNDCTAHTSAGICNASGTGCEWYTAWNICIIKPNEKYKEIGANNVWGFCTEK